jgi:RHS repeat-associated protein
MVADILTTYMIRLPDTLATHDGGLRDYPRSELGLRAYAATNSRRRPGPDPGLEAWTQRRPTGMEDERGDRYEYDEEGQLKKASYRAATPEGTPSGALRADEFQCDALGNRAGSNRVASRGVMTFERKNNKLNQYRGWWPYSITNYDEDLGGWGEPGEANGVLMQDGWITASFNALNQPMGMWSPMYPGGASVQWMWFAYDPLGRCVKRWVSPLVNGHAPPSSTNPATYLYYDGWNLVQEGSSANVADRVYVHGGRVDEIVASWTGGEWRHHHYDARGHCIMLTDPSGLIREQYDYDAFGLPYFYNFRGDRLGGTNRWGNRFLFTGREWLQDLKVYDFRNRMYQPELGRFLQPDPKEFEAGDYNLYRYCHNDPVNKADPMGLDTVSTPITVAIEKIKHMVLGSNIPHWITVVKIAFTDLAKATMSDHVDRAQAIFKDGNPSGVGKAYYVSHFKNGTFIKDEKHENIPVGDATHKVGVFLHFHDDVRPGDSSRDPSIPGADANAVRQEQAPMIYSATSLYRANQGVLITPNGQRDPAQTPVYFNW